MSKNYKATFTVQESNDKAEQIMKCFASSISTHPDVLLEGEIVTDYSVSISVEELGPTGAKHNVETKLE